MSRLSVCRPGNLSLGPRAVEVLVEVGKQKSKDFLAAPYNREKSRFV